MKLRPATPADIPRMLELAKHSVTAAHWRPDQYGAIFSSATPRSSLVLEENSTLQGFLIARDIGSECEIENIAVAGQARRRGLGTRLLGEFLNLAKGKGATVVHLEVRESNHAARALYEKWAFLESGRRRMYYRDPAEDAIIYRLEL